MELRVLIANGLILALAVAALMVPIGLWLRGARAKRRRRRNRLFGGDRPYFSNESKPRSPPPPYLSPGPGAPAGNPAASDPADGPAGYAVPGDEAAGKRAPADAREMPDR